MELFMKDDFWPVGISYRRFINFANKIKPRDASTLRLSENIITNAV